jgi:snRNA-activating protein complex subunit 3
VTKEDEKNKNAYPLQTFQSKIRRKKCVICDIYPASYAQLPHAQTMQEANGTLPGLLLRLTDDINPPRYLTYNDEQSPQNPCFFCEKCYAPFHYAYDSRGTLLLNHDVFKYHHE